VNLSACSGAPQGSAAALPAMGSAHSTAHRPAAPADRVIYVADLGRDAVEILKFGTWKVIGEITDGIRGPNAVWVDRGKNLYVANEGDAFSGWITEYDSSGKLVFKYKLPAADAARAVTTNKGINRAQVFVVGTSRGVIEFPQKSNAAEAWCSIPPSNAGDGIAVDDLAVYVNTGNGQDRGHIVVYPRGLKWNDCNHFTEPVDFGGPAGMAFDKQFNLLVCDQVSAVDILAAPYTKITGTLGSGWAGPISVSIDSAADPYAYVVDRRHNVLKVVTYPGGSVVATIGRPEGLDVPRSAVASDNYVP
jgi:hypothetical protein